jgi:hypothetical protein
MNLPEELMSGSLDEIIRRSTLRLEQEVLSVNSLRDGGHDQISAKTQLAKSAAVLDSLKVYRARFQ